MTFPFSLLPLCGLVRIHYPEIKADIDSVIFKLHYKISTTIYLLSAFLASEFFGPNIECNFLKEYRQEFVNSNCWASTTFSKPGMY